jgi:hypothetical protein
MELEYGVAFARRFEMLLVPEIVGTIYADASNRLTVRYAPRDRERTVKRASDDVASAIRMLRDDGGALRDFAPRYYEMIKRSLSISYFILGQHREGLWHAVDYIKQCRVTYVGLASIGLAAVSPKVFLQLRERRGVRKAMRAS